MDPYKVINYDSFDFKNSAIIKPKSENFDDTHRIPTKTTQVVVNSADRSVAYPSPSDYVVDLYEEIQDVISVELKFTTLKHNEYNVTDANRTITTSSASSPSLSVFHLEKGTYNGQSLASALSNLPIANSFIVAYNDLTQHMVFTATEEFTLHYDALTYNSSLLKMLGFPRHDVSAMLNPISGNYELESMYAVNLTPNNTIIMNIDTMPVKVSNNNVLNKAFAVLPPQLNNVLTSDIYSIKKSFNPPMGRIDKLRIRFQDVNGQPYDFQNRDHLLEFAFESHKNIRKYQAYTN